MKNLRTIFITLLLGWLHTSGVAQPSVLNSGQWYKLSVEKTGVYKISYDLLKKMKISPEQVDPKHLRMFGRRGGMLEQANASPRDRDLVELAIEVSGGDDGSFDRNDYILFFAEGPHEFSFDASKEIFFFKKNLYTDKSFYFLNVGDIEGKRIPQIANIDGDFADITQFNDFSYYENDEHNIERSGREWFGEKFNTITSHSLKFDLPGISAGSVAKVVSDVMAQSYTPSTFKVTINGVNLAEQIMGTIPNGRYTVKGIQRSDTISVNASDVFVGKSTHDVAYNFVKGSGFSQGYLNFIHLNVVRDLSLYGDQTAFVSARSLENSMSTFHISQASEGMRIWDITDHNNVSDQKFTFEAGSGSFSAVTTTLRKWIAFKGNRPEPVFEKAVPNQDLSSLSTPALLIVTHPDFFEEASRLAAHRQEFSGWSTHVVTTEEIFNQYSAGRPDVTAIRDFAKSLRDKDPTAMRALLLFGKGSYDYKDRLINNTNFVPIYQSRNSLHPLQTYASDDYFGFLEDNEGTWSEAPAQQHTLDIGVGRLPVTTVVEARNIVDKIIAYDKADNFGAWKKKIVFVADDGNTVDQFTSLHQYQADLLARYIDEYNPEVDTRRLFMGTYEKVVQPNAELVPRMSEDLRRTFEEGALVVNFTGHGSELVWADERILTEKTITELDNKRYPFLVTATCEFGRHDDPLLVSSAEKSVTIKGAGSIGLVTTSRPVNATTNFNLNDAFYEALFQLRSNPEATIGEVFRITKNNSMSGVLNRNFSLIGDPSMRLALPLHSIDVTSIKTATGSDTLKGLSMVTVSGEVVGPDGLISATFDGEATVTIWDREQEMTTTGKNDPAFQWYQRSNALFRGKASVTDGRFNVQFQMPANITSTIGEGKISMYAFDPQSAIDAMGSGRVKIGGTEAASSGDTTPPQLTVFIGDTTFINGGITTPDTDLWVKLQDNSGINISAAGGNNIVAILDNGDSHVLNDYYVSKKDNHKEGIIQYPLFGLSPGRHTLTVKAWDVYNNSSESSINFIVTDGEDLVIEQFGNYPNPFNISSKLFFTHNRSGDDLEAQLFIFSTNGELVRTADIALPASDYYNELIEIHAWDGGNKKLPPGLYLARLVVRSSSNGSKNEKVTKLILAN